MAAKRKGPFNVWPAERIDAGGCAWPFEHFESRDRRCPPERRHVIHVWLEPGGRCVRCFSGSDKASVLALARAALDDERAKHLRREARVASMAAGRTRQAQRAKRRRKPAEA